MKTEEDTFRKLRKQDFNNIEGKIRNWIKDADKSIADDPDIYNRQDVKDVFDSLGWTLTEYQNECKNREDARYNALTPDEKAIEDQVNEYMEQEAIKELLASGATQEQIDEAIKKYGSLTGIR
jgi:hypothetical protein